MRSRGRRSAAPVRGRRRPGSWQRLTILIAAVVGTAVMLYPATATWLSARAQSSTLSSFADEVARTPADTKSAMIQSARRYNAELAPGLIHDPFSAATDSESADQALTEEYLGQLKLPGDDVMARVTIPAIGVDLPIYHGTTDRVLTEGVGHLFGSSLPVGGGGSHAVLTAHSGLPESSMFTRLSRLRTGQTFTVDVLDEKLTYRVDQIRVVKPDDVEDLVITPGKDYVTLVTCTPINVNTHRLLVRGERIPTPHDASQRVAAPDTVGFPWWIVGFVVIVGASVALLYLPPRRARRRASYLRAATRLRFARSKGLTRP